MSPHPFPPDLIAASLLCAGAPRSQPGQRFRPRSPNPRYRDAERLGLRAPGEDLTDLVGPRLSGSAGAAAAVTQVADAMRKLGAKVTLQPVKVPHWVRGAESGELVDYRGRPAGVSQKIVLTGAGRLGRHPGRRHDAPR
jgi:carboxypeptidase Q